MQRFWESRLSASCCSTLGPFVVAHRGDRPAGREDHGAWNGRRRRGVTMVELLVVFAVIGILVALLLPAIMSSRKAARLMQCTSNLRQIGLAIDNYEADHQMLPPGASNGYSLHVFLLPYLDQTALYRSVDFDVSASSAPSLGKHRIDTYTCPSDPAGSVGLPAHGGLGSNYAGSFGSGAQTFGFNGMFRNLYQGTITLAKGPVKMGPLRKRDVIDGLSNTAAVSEILISNGTRHPLRVNWSTPTGLVGPGELEAFAQACASLSPLPASADLWGRGRMWTSGQNGDTLYNHILTPNRHSCHNSGSVPTGAYTAASLHAAGVNVLFGDGHVTFVTETVDKNVWRAIGSRKGGEPASQL